MIGAWQSNNIDSRVDGMIFVAFSVVTLHIDVHLLQHRQQVARPTLQSFCSKQQLYSVHDRYYKMHIKCGSTLVFW